MDTKKITITKVDEPTPPPKKEVPKPEVKAGKKTLKTFPKGILKTAKQPLRLKGVRDPAKSSALKKGMAKHTLKLLTTKGARKHQKTLKHKISKMTDGKVKEIMQKAGLSVNPSTPPEIRRQMLEGASAAGFVSLD